MSKIKATREEMLAAVKAHALENYSKGWDVVVECYGDDGLLAVITPVANTTLGAIRAVSTAIVRTWREGRANAAF